jgi:hypothetical protein
LLAETREVGQRYISHLQSTRYKFREQAKANVFLKSLTFVFFHST